MLAEKLQPEPQTDSLNDPTENDKFKSISKRL